VFKSQQDKQKYIIIITIHEKMFKPLQRKEVKDAIDKKNGEKNQKKGNKTRHESNYKQYKQL
jgi:hypothetical protein